MQRQRPSTTVLSRNTSCCYIDQDEACDRSLDDMEAGLSHLRRRSFMNGYLVKAPFVVSSPRMRYYEDKAEEAMKGELHFLDSCFFCAKLLRNNYQDIFMYRGDTPFCSEECRQEQIELDQQRERNINISYSMRAIWNKEQQQQQRQQQQQEGRSNSPDRSLRTGTVAVA